MASDAPLSDAQQIYDMKRRVTEMVRIRFARYGDNVLAIILGYALQPSRMPQLLDRLGLRATSRSIENNLDVLTNFLAVQGAQVFVQRAMNLNQKREEVKGIDVEKFEAVTQTLSGGPDAPAAGTSGSAVGATVNTPGYSGPERRKTERRQENRRDGLAAINRNKRFGGDRRKELRGRRAEDRVRPDRWWLHLSEKNAEALLPFLKRKN